MYIYQRKKHHINEDTHVSTRMHIYSCTCLHRRSDAKFDIETYTHIQIHAYTRIHDYVNSPAHT